MDDQFLNYPHSSNTVLFSDNIAHPPLDSYEKNNKQTELT